MCGSTTIKIVRTAGNLGNTHNTFDQSTLHARHGGVDVREMVVSKQVLQQGFLVAETLDD
jgi:hypothetical protein